MPRRAERLVRWSLAPWERKTVLGDLQEEFEELSQSHGPKRARRWYWSQAIRSVWPNVLRRLNGDDERHAMFVGGVLQLGMWTFACLVMLVLAVVLPGRAEGNFVDVLGRAMIHSAYFVVGGISLVLVSLFHKSIRRPKPRHAIALAFVFGLSLIIPFALFYPDRPVPFFVSLGALSVLTSLWPRSPAAPMTEYVVGAPTDSPADALTLLSTVVPNSPLGLSGLMLCRPTDAADAGADSVLRVWDPTIKRKFRPLETIRVCGFVNKPTDDTNARVSLVDERGQAVNMVETKVRHGFLEQIPQTWTEVADVDPADHFGRIDVPFSFAGVAPGAYRLRLEVSDGTRTEQREEQIAIAEQPLSSH